MQLMIGCETTWFLESYNTTSSPRPASRHLAARLIRFVPTLAAVSAPQTGFSFSHFRTFMFVCLYLRYIMLHLPPPATYRYTSG